MQGPTRTKEIGGRTYTVRQPTLLEMVNFTEHPPEPMPGFEVVDALLLAGEEMEITDLLAMSDATPEELKVMTEDDLVALALKIKEVNPRFFQMRSRLLRMGQELASETLQH